MALQHTVAGLWPVDVFTAQPPRMCVSCGRRSGIARNTPLRSAVCGPCWFASGASAAPSELVGEPAAPESVLPRTALDWAKALFSSPWFTQRRSDSASRLRLLVRALALHASWEDHSTWPTWERLMAATGWSRSTMSSWLAELHRLGWLERLEHGSTPQFRPMALQHVEGNRAAVYQLRIPVEATSDPSTNPEVSTQTRTPTTSRTSSFSRKHVLPTRANSIIHSQAGKAQVRSTNAGPTGPRLDEGQGRFFDLRVPTTRAQMLAAAAELKLVERALWRLSPRAIRALIKPWWSAGWTNSDVLHALNHTPAIGGSRKSDRCPAGQLRRPDGWIRHRFSHWLDTGTPLPAPRVWAQLRDRVAHSHGAAAADRLPYGATELRADHLAASRSEQAAAVEQLTRQWAREFHERRNAPRADHEVARPEVRQPLVRAWKTTPPRATTVESETQAPPVDTPAAAADTAPLPRTEPSTYERALERARAEGRIARPRRARRRNRW